MSNRPRNAFLRSLDEATFAELEPHLAPMELAVGQLVYQPDDRVEWVYFPESCLMSLLTSTAQGETVETAMVGVEGAAGLLEACGSGHIGLQCFVQIDGRALRAPAHVVRRLAVQDEAFARQIWRLIEFQLGESRQSGLCNAVHTVEHRLSRWLLESHERCGGRTQLPLTQEFMAAMLGVQRTTVNGFAAQLQKHGLISYRRGRVEIVDPSGLEHHACECRAATRALRERLGVQVVQSALRVVDRDRRTPGDATA